MWEYVTRLMLFGFRLFHVQTLSVRLYCVESLGNKPVKSKPGTGYCSCTVPLHLMPNEP
jgi:hypothetical protein